jgi:hypothetical protein
MPTLWTRLKSKDTDATPACDFQTLENNQFITIESTSQDPILEKLKKRCKKFKEELIDTSPHKEKIIRAANFKLNGDRSVMEMIKKNPNMFFLRVYYGIDDNGEHVCFLSLTPEDNPNVSIADPIFLDNCCHCPPMSNCPKDQLLEN